MKIKLLIPIIAIAAMAFQSCKKTVKGCMTSTAENFNVEAEEDDGSCKFKANYIVWQYKTNSDQLVAAGSKTLTVFFDNVQVGTFEATKHTGTSGGSCSNSSSSQLSGIYDMGNVDDKAVMVLVKDETGKQVFSRSTTFRPGTSCVSIYLE